MTRRLFLAGAGGVIGRHLIPLLLEPESSWGILTDTGEVPSMFSHYAQEGKTYPIMRQMEKTDLPLEEIK